MGQLAGWQFAAERFAFDSGLSWPKIAARGGAGRSAWAVAIPTKFIIASIAGQPALIQARVRPSSPDLSDCA